MVLEVDTFERKFRKENNEDPNVHAFIDDQTK